MNSPGVAAEWKAGLAEALAGTAEPQLRSCEQALVDGLRDDAIVAARTFVESLLGHGTVYINCKFGENTPAARAATNELVQLLFHCVMQNLDKLLGKDWAGFFSAVTTCVIGGLIGGGSGGQSDYNPAEDPRTCG